MDNRKYREQPAGAGQPEAAPAPVLSVDEARAVLSRSILLLDEVVVVARGVIASTPREVAVAVFVHDQPIAVEGLSSPQQRPRGRAHPLLALVKLGVSAARLVKQLVRALYPDSLDAPAASAMPAPDAQVVSSFENVVSEMMKQAREMGLDTGAA
jgi:hypothetical protein